MTGTVNPLVVCSNQTPGELRQLWRELHLPFLLFRTPWSTIESQIYLLTRENAELKAWKQEYSSAKQSVCRMSIRLRKLCKRLTANHETVLEMQKIADEIRELIKTNCL